MAILVVDPGPTSGSFADMLAQHGYEVARITNLSELRPGPETRGYELALCPVDLDSSAPLSTVEALAERCPELPLVLVLQEEIPSRYLLHAIRCGVVDVLDARTTPAAQLAAIDAVLMRILRRSAPEEALSGAAPAQAGAEGQAAALRRRNEAQLKELQRDQRAGRYIQLGMLPPSPMAVDGYRLRHKIFPSLLLSGDFVDYFRVTDRHFVFYMADVSGHGASSAFVTVLLKNFSRRMRREYTPRMLGDPGRILLWLNRELLDNELDKHVAIFIGVVDLETHLLSFANAGHYPTALLAGDEGIRTLELVGKPVGLFRELSYASEQVALPPGCEIFLVSDGVLETMGEAPLSEKERRLLDAAWKSHQGDGEIWQILNLAQHESNPDDMACLTVSREL